MSPPKQVALDTSILVGLVDSRDIWHPAAITLRDALKGAQMQLGIECIATFDSDFDSIAWLKRLSSPDDITSLLTPSR